MAPVRYEKTMYSNIHKQCNLFVCQIGSHPNLLRFKHATLERVVAWRDKTKAKWQLLKQKIKCDEFIRKTSKWMTSQKTRRQKLCQKRKVLLRRGTGIAQRDKHGRTARGYKTNPNTMSGVLQGTPTTRMGCGRNRGIRGTGATSMGRSGESVQRDDISVGHSSKSVQGEENLGDGLSSTTCRRSRRIELQRRSALG